MKLEKIKIIIAIVVAVITMIGTILTIDKYFAKTEEVKKAVEKIDKEHAELEDQDRLVQERLDISITDDQIFQQQQQILQMKNYYIFEQKKDIPEMTPMEIEAIKNAEERLEKLEKVKVEKIKRYEQMKK